MRSDFYQTLALYKSFLYLLGNKEWER